MVWRGREDGLEEKRWYGEGEGVHAHSNMPKLRNMKSLTRCTHVCLLGLAEVTDLLFLLISMDVDFV